MKKSTKTMLLTAVLAAGLSLPAVPALAANVQATLPTFPVTLNGTTIDNSYRQYPLLVCKGITYFPMTYYDCRFLGVETEWTRQNGLRIEKSDLTGAYHQDTVKQKNGRSAVAAITTGKITVNGKAINNSKEPYPLISYRNVTYFPLTWRFAVDEFGWQYSYDDKKGLVINANNAKTTSVTLQDARKSEYEYDQFSFAADGQYLYYQGEKGAVYQRPLATLTDEKQRRKIAEIPYEDDYYVGYPHADFYEEGGHAYFRYHSGGATFGGDYLYRIDPGQTIKEIIEYTYDEYTDFGEFQIFITGTMIGGKPATPMTYIDKSGKTKPLGEEGYCYKLNCTAYDKKRNQLIVSAAKGQSNQTYLYSVNLTDGATTKCSRYATSNYQAVADQVYYLTYYKPEGQADADYSQQYLYALDLTTGREQYIGYVGTSEITYETLYAATNNGVYYRDGNSGSLIFYNHNTGKREIVNNGFKVHLLEAQNGYVAAGFEEIAKNDCRLAVYQPTKQGYTTVFESADVSDKAVINPNGLLMYRLAGTNQLVQVQL